ncbi:MAG: branched-chain amino acid ABC transporter permease [Chloroflexota bacterium]
MTTFISLTIHGVAVAASLFMVAAGLSLIFGLMGVMNFAHGSFFLWGAYSWLAVFNRTGNFWIALIAATLTGGALGLITERVFMRPLYRRPLQQILATLGIGLVLNQVVIAVWGQNPQPIYSIAGLDSTVRAGGIIIPSYHIFMIGIGSFILLAVWCLLHYTRVGLIVRAGVENPIMVGALGINVGRIFLAVFALGASLAALGGAVYGPIQNAVTADMGQSTLLLAIIVVVLGGLGSYVGSAIGALLIGLAQEYVPYYALQILPQGSTVSPASLTSLASLFLLVVVLLIRPQGLMGVKLEGHL